MRDHFVAFLACLLVSSGLQAQYQFSRFLQYGSSEGLSIPFVTCIRQTEPGYLWVGTQDGLNRFDGSTFRVYRKGELPHALPWSHIRSMAEDLHSKTLWIATSDRGLYLYDQQTDAFHQALATGSPRLVSEFTTHLCRTSHFLWVSTLNGFSVIDPASRKVVRNYPIDAPFRDIIPVSASEVWAFARSGMVYVLDEGSARLKDSFRLSQAVGQEIKDVWRVFTSRNSAWICTRGGLFEKNAGGRISRHRIVTDQRQDLSASFVRCAWKDRRNNLWIGIDSLGLYLQSAGSAYFRHLSGSEARAWTLSDRYLTEIYEDREGAIWVATERGLNQLVNQVPFFTTIGAEIDPRLERIFALAPMGRGLVVGSKNNAPCVVDTTTGRIMPVKNATSTAALKARYIHPVSADTAWVGGVTGLYLLVRQDEEYTLQDPPYPELGTVAGMPIRAMLWLNRDTCLMGGNEDNGLIWWDRKRGQIQVFRQDPSHRNTSLADNYLSRIVKDQAGLCWIATDDGISRFDPGTLRFQSFLYKTDKGEGHFVYDIIPEGDGLWLALFQEGLGRWSMTSRQLVIYNERQGLSNSSIYNICPDAADGIWMSTNSGLSFFNKKRKHFINYTVRDGIQDNVFNNYSAYTTANRIYFGGLNGLTAVNRDQASLYHPFPDVTITAIRYANNQEYRDLPAHQAGVKLKHNQNDITFSFSVLDFTLHHRMQYAYRLEGYNRQWIPLEGSGPVAYTNLDPGTYTFHVRGANHEFTGEPKITSFQFTIVPVWYQTRLFKVLLLLAIALLLFFGARAYYRFQLRRQQREYEKLLAIQEERQRISSEIHDDIGAGLSGVRLLTEITRSKLPDEKSREELSKIHHSLADLSAKMREVIWSLDRDNDTLQNLVFYIQRQGEQLFAGSATRLQVQLPDTIPPVEVQGENRRQIFLAVKEALHNCLKHAEASTCRLAMSVTGTNFSIEITDNGKGLPKKLSREGYGLKNMKRRLGQVGGKMRVQGEDGTHISFTIPLNQLGTHRINRRR